MNDSPKDLILLIAPCGMNCGICAHYLAEKQQLKQKGISIPYCPGCRPRDKQCAYIKKGCDSIRDGTYTFCIECDKFPCENLEKLDKRYTMKYHMSMIDNLIHIKKRGIESFLNSERKRWTCQKCGSMISCHNGICFLCGLEILRHKKKRYHWGDG